MPRANGHGRRTSRAARDTRSHKVCHQGGRPAASARATRTRAATHTHAAARTRRVAPRAASIEQHPDVEIHEIQSEFAGAWKIVVRNLDDAEKGMADLDLSLSAQKLSLEVRGRPAPIVVLLPSAVDEDSAIAKFSAKRRELVVTLRPLLLPELD